MLLPSCVHRALDSIGNDGLLVLLLLLLLLEFQLLLLEVMFTTLLRSELLAWRLLRD